jgi:hypothetical protein
MNQQKANLVRAFLQGLTGAGLFRRLDYPGAPTEFVDSRPIREILASGDFERNSEIYQKAKIEMLRSNARAPHREADETRVRTHR